MDLSQFDKTKTIEDYRNAYDAQRQSLAASKLDQLSKQNIYATQLLSGVSATGNQNAYDAARQHLADNGVDLSSWAPDVATGAKQANAARQAQYTQNPLLPLANLAVKQDQVTATNAATTGDVIANPNARSDAIMGATGRTLGGGQIPMQPAQPAPQWQNPDAAPINPQVTTRNLPPLPNSNVQTPIVQPIAQVAPNPTQTPNYYGTIENGYRAPDGSFLPPADIPDKNFAFNKAKRDLAYDVYKSAPAVKIADAAASVTGKNQADATKEAIASKATYDQVAQTIQGLKDLNDSAVGLPQERYGIPAVGNAWFNQNFGNQKLADNAGVFKKQNEAQTIGAIKELAATGQIRMTRTLENILNQGYLIDPNSSKEGKNRQADVILKELENSKIAAENVNAGLQGRPSSPYQSMPAVPSKAEQIVNDSGINTAPPKKGESRNGYLFVGGNPNDKNNWKLK